MCRILLTVFVWSEEVEENRSEIKRITVIMLRDECHYTPAVLPTDQTRTQFLVTSATRH